MYFSIEPMVTAPRPSFSVQAPSHSRSCGQMRPQTSGSELVLMRQLRGLEQLAVADQVQPVRNVVVYRAFPFAERIAAGQAAAGLLRGAVGIERRVDLVETLMRSATGIFSGSRRGNSRNCSVLSTMVSVPARQAARRRSSISESIEAAFGFTSQKWPMKERRSFRISSPQTLPVSATCMLDQLAQVLHVRVHAVVRDAMDVDQLMVVAIDEVALHDRARRRSRR